MNTHATMWLALLLSVGCTPAPPLVRQRQPDGIIQPAADLSPQGALFVETEEDKLQTAYDSPQRYPFYVYDQQGRFLEVIHNDIMTPISIDAGQYTVRSWAQGAFRCVPVSVQSGRTTRVSSLELEHGPLCN